MTTKLGARPIRRAHARLPRPVATECEAFVLQGGDLADLHGAVLADVRAVTCLACPSIVIWQDTEHGLRALRDPPDADDGPRDAGTRVSVQLRLGTTRVGVLDVADGRGPPTPAAVRNLEAISPSIAVALHVTALRLGSRRRQTLDELFRSMAIDIASGRNLQDLLGQRLKALCGALDASLVALVPLEGEPVVWRGDDGAAEHLEQSVLVEAGDCTSLRRYGVGARRAGESGWSVVHVPIAVGNKRVATLSALGIGGEPFADDACQALSRFANLVALAWATERYQRTLADSARSAERRRIADELHDQVAQLLFAARLKIDHAGSLAGLPDEAGEDLRRSSALVLQADVAIREVMRQLSTADGDGLLDRFAELAVNVEEEFGHPVQLDITPAAVAAAARAGPSTVTLLARAAREALVNAAKHAGPCKLAIQISVTRRERLLLSVIDDGIGTSGRRCHGYGTAAIRRAVQQQGGILRITDGPVGGTRMTVSLPL